MYIRGTPYATGCILHIPTAPFGRLHQRPVPVFILRTVVEIVFS